MLAFAGSILEQLAKALVIADYALFGAFFCEALALQVLGLQEFRASDLVVSRNDRPSWSKSCEGLLQHIHLALPQQRVLILLHFFDRIVAILGIPT